MRIRSLLPLLAIVLLGAALFLLVRGRGGGGADGVEAATRSGAPPESAPTDLEAAPPPADRPELPEAVPEPEPVFAETPAAAPVPVALPLGPPDRDRELHGRVVGAVGQGLAGAELVITQAAFRGFRLSDPDLGAVEQVIGRLQTGADGSFRLPLEPGYSYDLEVAAEGYARVRLRNLAAGERAEIELPAAATLEGVVRRGDGLPVAGARVALAGPDQPLQETTSDVDGRYRFADLAPGRAVARVLPVDEAPAPLAFLSIEGGERNVRDFVIARGVALRGTVRARESGEPLAGARVETLDDARRSATTDETGRFVLLGMKPGTPVRAVADGHAPATGLAPAGSGADESASLDLELEPGRSLSGVVLDALGDPAAEAWVAAVGREAAADARPFRVVRSAADGRFVFEGLRRDRAYGFWVHLPGQGSAWLPAPEAPRSAGQADVQIRLEAPAALAGRLQPGGNEAAAGRWIELQRVDALDAAEAMPAPDASRTVRADDLGRFRIADLRPGRYLVALRGANGVPELPVEVELHAGEAYTDLELDGPGVRSLGGVVLDPLGAPAAGAIVWVFAEDEDPALSRETRSDAAGRFRFEGLRAVPHNLGVQPDPDAGPQVYAALRSNGVLPGAEELELRLPVGEDLTGRVVDDRSMPVAGADVVARLDGRWGVAHARTDAQGRFRLRVPVGARVDLEVRPPAAADGGASAWRPRSIAAVPAGGDDLSIRLLRKL
ncbi:MAG TPA: carboxypeptidase-like regulatory domain-containing protein [Planctomycetota bacterium]